MIDITIIICTYNRAKYLKQALQSVVSQIYPQNKYEIIVVDNNSDDNTFETVGNLSKKNLRYIFEKQQGLSYARNTGAKKAFGRYVAYIDDDAIADKQWIRKAVAIIDNYGPDIFGGPIYPYYEFTTPTWFKDKYETRMPALEAGYLGDDSYLSGSNLFIKRKTIEKIGYFDVNLGMKGKAVSLGEEVKFQKIAREKNLKIYFDTELVVRHLVPVEKTSIKYVIKRHLESSRDSYKIIHDKWSLGDFRAMVRNFLILQILIVYYPFRSRKKYPCWQNFFIEKVLHRWRSFLWFYWDIKELFYGKG